MDDLQRFEELGLLARVMSGPWDNSIPKADQDLAEFDDDDVLRPLLPLNGAEKKVISDSPDFVERLLRREFQLSKDDGENGSMV